MKLRFIVAALAALIAPACAIAEQQSPAHTPQVSETSSGFVARLPNTHQTWDNIAKWELNPALRAIASNNYGSSCDAVPTPYPGQICVDATQRAVKLYTAPVGSSIFTWNTLATIASDGKLSQSGALNFKGSWNATTNSPALVSSVGTAGDYYVVTTAGTTTLNGVSSWSIGDEAVFSSGAWIKIPGASPVQSVAGLTGTIGAAPLKTALAISYADLLGAPNNPTFTGEMNSGLSGGYVGNYMFLQGAGNALWFYVGGNGTDLKEWRVYPDATKLHFSLDDDLQVARLDWLSVTRVGVASATSYFNSMVGIGIDSTVVADSSTDVGAKINAALNKYGYVKLPQPMGTAFYRSSVTVTIPGGATLEGTGTDSCTTCSGGVSPGTEIRCDAGVSPCIKIGQGVAGGAAARLSNVKQSHAGTQPAAGAGIIGIQFSGGVNSKADHVSADKNSICMLWRTPPGTNTGISAILDNIHAYNCSDVYFWQDGWPEIRMTNSRAGEINEVASNAYMRISCTQHNCSGPGAPNGFSLTNVQLNSSSPTPVTDLLQLTDLGTHIAPPGGADAEMPIFDAVHAENFTNFMRSDSSWDVALGMMCSASSFYVNGGATFALSPSTSVDNWNFNGCNFVQSLGGSTFTLNPSGNSIYSPFAKSYINRVQWNGGIIGMAGSITGQWASGGVSTLSMMGVSHGDNFTLAGGWANLSKIGGNWTGGNLIDSTSSSDDVTIIENGILKFHGARGVSCTSGISATTGRSSNGLITAC